MPGCYGQYGTIGHDCLEKYALGELAEYELSDYYKSNFDKAVTEFFPYNKNVDLREKYYQQGLEYFNSFSGFGDREILQVEGEYLFKIGDYNFTGKIDLECPAEIIDHKSKAEQHLKRLNKNHDKPSYLTMLDGRFIHKDNFKQLYIYSIPFFNKYEKYPEILSLNMFRIMDWYSIKFNLEDFEEAKQWAINQIDSIYAAEKFEKGADASSYWCSNVCGQRLNCVHSDRYLGVEA